MEIIYTEHARDQIKERKLEKIWVEEAIKFPDEKRHKGIKSHAIKKINGVKIKVVYVKEKYIKVVTVFLIK